MESIDPSKRAQLHEVADLMLEIYKTLVRMRYLDSSWIHEGPHNIDALLPMYRSLGVHDSVIYLYSILPYIDTSGAEDVDFFQGGLFADFRRKDDAELGRDPLYDGNDLASHITPLSLLGNRRSVIIYNSRTHCISIIDQESDRSTDHNIYREGDYVDDQHAGGDMDWELHEADAEVEDGDENEDDEDDDSYDEDEDEDELFPSRPAGNVLRDIIQWYHDLVESPGGGELCEGQWRLRVVKQLYREHGWPHAHFDGDAFLIDLARAEASDMAKYDIEEPKRQLHLMEHALGYEKNPAVRWDREDLARAQTVQDKWVARFKSWQTERRYRPDTEEMRRVKEERDGIKYEELPLHEVKKLRTNLRWRERELRESQQDAARESTDKGVEVRLRYAEEKMKILQEAYKASRADADRLFPGRSTTPEPGVEIEILERRRDQLARNTEKVKRDIEALHDWRSQVPAGASEARKLAQEYLDSVERSLEAHLDQSRGVADALEKYKLKDYR